MLNKNIKFNSRRDSLIYVMLFFSVGIMIIPLITAFSGDMGLEIFIITLVIIIITALLLWIIFGTRYIITGTHILYNSGPLKGKIEINSIHTIIEGKSLYIGFRPATAGKGVIIKYGKYDEIYFSPDTNERFIEEVLKINPKIRIEE